MGRKILKKPEVLVGTERSKTTILYRAGAVFLGGEKRMDFVAIKELRLCEMKEAVDFTYT